MTTTFTVLIDFDKNGTWTDVTDYYEDCSIAIGLSDVKDLVAQAGKCSLLLNNTDLRFSPDYAGPYYGKLTAGAPVWIKVNDGTTYTLFRGYTSRWVPMSGQRTARTCTLECVDALDKMGRVRVSMPLQETVRGDELITHLLNYAFAGVQANGEIMFAGLPGNGDTVTVDGITYTFRTTLSTAPVIPNEVKIGATIEITIDNLCAALNAAAGAGSLYTVGTTQPATCTATPALTYYRHTIEDGAIRYYRLGEAAGTSAADGGINNRAGTYSGTPGLAAKGALQNTAITLDGVNDYVSLPTLALANASFTIEVWAKLEVHPVNTFQDIFYAESGGGEYMVVRLYNDQSLAVIINAGSFGAASVITFGVWMHIVVVYNYAASLCSLYINGNFVISSAIGPYTGANPALFFGADYWICKGDIDEAAIYLTALSAARVAAHYAARLTNYDFEVQKDSPVRYYLFNESSGTTAVNEGTGASGDGTYTGGVTLGAAGALSADGGKGDLDTAVLFDGTDDCVNLPILSFTNRAFTYECWIKPTSSGFPAQADIISLDASSSGNHDRARLLLNSDGSLLLAFRGDNLGATAAGVVIFGVWNYLVFTYDYITNLSSLYVNGTLVISAAHGPLSSVTMLSLYIGAFQGASQFFKGDIDEVAIYFGTLTADQVAAHNAVRYVTPGAIILSKIPGVVGNVYTLAKSGANITLSGATLAGGADMPDDPVASIETGIQEFDMAGDRWSKDKTNVFQAIREVTESERGLAWIARNGAFTWKNGQWLLKQAAAGSALTLSGETFQEGAKGEEEIYNQVTVSVTPRSTSAQGVVAQMQGTQVLPGRSGEQRYNPATYFNRGDGINQGAALAASGSKTITLPFTDPVSGKRCGARDLVLPLVPGTDFEAWENADKTGQDYTYYTDANAPLGVLAFSVAVTASEAQVSVKNIALGPIQLVKLQVRGKLLSNFDQKQLVAEDLISQADYGLRALSIALPLPVSERFAKGLANYLLGRFKTPVMRIRSLDTKKEYIGGSLWALEIGSILTITDTQLAVSSEKYLIIGVRYRFSPKNVQAIGFNVTRVEDITYWILGDATYGKLGSTTRLGI